jgi:SAM-dependent methyltransferase
LLGRVQRIGQRLIFNHAFTRLPLRALAECPPGAVLDVGCGRGDLGAALARRGWRVAGIDPSPSACAIARTRGVEAEIGTLDSVRPDAASFDAVVMSHSLEHVPDPRAELSRVLRVLRPGGLVVISVPNFGCWQRLQFGSSWFQLDLPRHRTHFTRTSLEHALMSVGFDVASIQATSDNGFSLITTVQYQATGRLVLRPGAWYWALYVLTPINRALDHARGEGPLLHAVARRPERVPTS